MKNDQGIVGIPTRFGGPRRKTGGLHKSDLIIIAGRPLSMGKTALATNIASCCKKNSDLKMKNLVVAFSSWKSHPSTGVN